MEYSKLPDLTSLATLKAIVEQGGVSEAARSLHVGQPAVTKRLRALEVTYKLPLMQRVSGRLRLTEAGKKVYATATMILDRHSALQEELQNLAKGNDILHLEVTFAIGEHLLPDLLIKFNEDHPEYRIESRLAYSRRISKNLVTGKVDMALLESTPEHPEILVQKWQDDELWLICSANHPLANTKKISLEELAKLRFVLREPRSSIRTALDTSLAQVGFDRLNIAFEVGSTEAIIDVLVRGKYVSFVPRFSVLKRVADGELRHIEIEGLQITRTLWIARNRNALNHRVAESFIKLIQSNRVPE